MTNRNMPVQKGEARPATQNSNIVELKNMLGADNVKKRFEEVLGKKAPQFTASIVNVVSGNTMLKKCSVASVIGAAFVAATYDLPIDSNLGFSAIVPYNNKKKNEETGKWETKTEAQFQMMYKGFVQLAIRSGQYKRMNNAVVYQDEVKSYNPITGEIEFVDDFTKCTQRAEGNPENVVGYYAWFELTTGFRHDLYMTVAEVKNHAMKYSQSYRKDIDSRTTKSIWSQNFETMALKTVIKRLLSKWGILSIEMQKAMTDDQQVFDAEGNGHYADNQPEEIEAMDPFSQPEEPEEIEGEAEEIPEAPAPNPPAAKNAAKTARTAAQTQQEPEQYDFAQYEQDFANFDESQMPFK